MVSACGDTCDGIKCMPEEDCICQSSFLGCLDYDCEEATFTCCGSKDIKRCNNSEPYWYDYCLNKIQPASGDCNDLAQIYVIKYGPYSPYNEQWKWESSNSRDKTNKLFIKLRFHSTDNPQGQQQIDIYYKVKYKKSSESSWNTIVDKEISESWASKDCGPDKTCKIEKSHNISGLSPEKYQLQVEIYDNDGVYEGLAEIRYWEDYVSSDSFCGDGIVEDTEECDGNNMDGNSCTSLGYDGGTLSCQNCKYDTSNCYFNSDEAKVNKDVSTYNRLNVKMWGAGGGGANNNWEISAGDGGAGGYVEAKIDLSDFKEVELWEGEGGEGPLTSNGPGKGGWPNGGSGGDDEAGGGGGETKIIGIKKDGSKHLLVVAGAGGGGGIWEEGFGWQSEHAGGGGAPGGKGGTYNGSTALFRSDSFAIGEDAKGTLSKGGKGGDAGSGYNEDGSNGEGWCNKDYLVGDYCITKKGEGNKGGFASNPGEDGEDGKIEENYYIIEESPQVESYSASIDYGTKNLRGKIAKVEKNKATLKGELTSLGEEEKVDVYFKWGTNPNYLTNITTLEEKQYTGTFSHEINVDYDTTYYFKAKAEDVEGEQKSFTTKKESSFDCSYLMEEQSEERCTGWLQWNYGFSFDNPEGGKLTYGDCVNKSINDPQNYGHYKESFGNCDVCMCSGAWGLGPNPGALLYFPIYYLQSDIPGRCAGMALSTLQFYYGDDKKENYDRDVDRIAGLSENSNEKGIKLLDHIEAMNARSTFAGIVLEHWSKSDNYWLTNKAGSRSGSSAAQVFINNIKNDLNKNPPQYGMLYMLSQFGGITNHTVTIDSIEETTNGTKIYLYDNNIIRMGTTLFAESSDSIPNKNLLYSYIFIDKEGNFSKWQERSGRDMREWKGENPLDRLVYMPYSKIKRATNIPTIGEIGGTLSRALYLLAGVYFNSEGTIEFKNEKGKILSIADNKYEISDIVPLPIPSRSSDKNPQFFLLPPANYKTTIKGDTSGSYTSYVPTGESINVMENIKMNNGTKDTFTVEGKKENKSFSVSTSDLKKPFSVNLIDPMKEFKDNIRQFKLDTEIYSTGEAILNLNSENDTLIYGNKGDKTLTYSLEVKNEKKNSFVGVTTDTKNKEAIQIKPNKIHIIKDKSDNLTIKKENIPNAEISCDTSNCKGGKCEKDDWITYQPTSDLDPCFYKLVNNSTDNDSTNLENNNDIKKTSWYIKEKSEDNYNLLSCGEVAGFSKECTLQEKDIPSPGEYEIKLKVEDSYISDVATRSLTVKKEIEAGFKCSLTKNNWKECNEIREPSVEEVMYFKDFSKESEGGEVIKNRTWRVKEDDGIYSEFGKGKEIASTTIPAVKTWIKIEVEDNLNRKDQEEKLIKGSLPLPDWKEITP